MRNPIKKFADYMVEYYVAKSAALLLRYGREAAKRSVRFNNYNTLRDVWANRGGVL